MVRIGHCQLWRKRPRWPVGFDILKKHPTTCVYENEVIMKGYVTRSKGWLAKVVLICWVVSMISLSVSAADPKPSGFMDRKQMTIRGDLPFELSWIKPGVLWAKYKKIVIAPVDTTHLMKADFWQEMGRSDDIEKDIKKLALYTRSSFLREFFMDPNKRFKVTYSMEPNPDTLQLEMALTELTPNKVLLKAAGYVPLYGLVAKAVNQTNTSYVAIEIRLKDARTGEILAKFADKKNEPLTFVNVNQMTWYGFAEKRVDQWALKLVETLNRRPGQVVEGSSNIDLSLW